MSINSFLFDYTKDTKIEKIEFSDIDNVNPFTKKIKFYNPLVSEPLHKFWFYISNAKNIKKNTIQNTITIVLSSNESNLISSIKHLDKKTNEIIQQKKMTANIKNSITTYTNHPPTFVIYIDSDSKCFDSKNNPIEFSQIKLNDSNVKLHLYIEFDSIIFSSSSSYRKWRVIQLKEYESINLSVSLFDSILPSLNFTTSNVPPNIPIFYNSNNDQSQNISSHTLYPQIPYISPYNVPPSNSTITSSIPPPPPPPNLLSITKEQKVIEKPEKKEKDIDDKKITGFKPPSINELLSAKNKLKKSNNDIANNIVSYNNNTNNINNTITNNNTNNANANNNTNNANTDNNINNTNTDININNNTNNNNININTNTNINSNNTNGVNADNNINNANIDNTLNKNNDKNDNDNILNKNNNNKNDNDNILNKNNKKNKEEQYTIYTYEIKKIINSLIKYKNNNIEKTNKINDYISKISTLK